MRPGSKRPLEKSLWVLDSELDKDVHIEEHIKQLTEFAGSKADALGRLLARGGTDFDILTDFSDESGQYPVNFDPAILKQLGELSISLFLTWWMPGEESNPEA